MNTISKLITEKEGLIISEATLKIEDLLSASYDFMSAHQLNEKLQNEICKTFEVVSNCYNNCHRLCTIPDKNQDTANELWNEDVFNYFNSIAPAGYYFGSSEGDGACIGWFKMPPEETEFLASAIINISGEKVTVNICVNNENNLVLYGIGNCTYEFFNEELILMREKEGFRQ